MQQEDITAILSKLDKVAEAVTEQHKEQNEHIDRNAKLLLEYLPKGHEQDHEFVSEIRKKFKDDAGAHNEDHSFVLSTRSGLLKIVESFLKGIGWVLFVAVALGLVSWASNIKGGILPSFGGG